MTEFVWGDRVTKIDMEICGTVVNDSLLDSESIGGFFEDCLPLPVAVAWDYGSGIWWEKNEDLELA